MWVDKFQNNFIYLVWAADTGSAKQALPLKCREVRGGFAIDPRSARTAVNVGVGKKSRGRAQPKLLLPWIALLLFPGQHPRGVTLKAVFMDVPAGTNNSPRAGSLPCTPRALRVSCRDAERWWARARQRVWHLGLSLGLREMAACRAFLEVQGRSRICSWWVSHCLQAAFRGTAPVSLLNEGGNRGLTGKIKDYEGNFKASSGQGFNLNECQHSLLCWKTYRDIKT